MTNHFISILLILTLFGKIKPDEWQRLDFGYFSLKTPKGWTIVKMKGEDAFVGGITNGKDSISYYFGRYINGFKNVDTSKYVLLQDTINSKRATIRIQKNKFKGGIEMFIDSANGWNKFAMWTDNISDTNLIFKVFKSVSFK